MNTANIRQVILAFSNNPSLTEDALNEMADNHAKEMAAKPVMNLPLGNASGQSLILNYVEVTPTIIFACQVLVYCNRLIAAVKLIRELTGAGLYDSKKFVDNLPRL